MKKVRIISDGTGKGTKVLDEAGEDIPGAYAFSLSGSRMKAVTEAVVYCHPAAVDFVGKASIVADRTAYSDAIAKKTLVGVMDAAIEDVCPGSDIKLWKFKVGHDRHGKVRIVAIFTEQ